MPTTPETDPEFFAAIHRTIDRKIVRDHETAHRLLDSLDLPDDEFSDEDGDVL